MTPSDFRGRLKALGLTVGGFAARAGVAETTAANWGKVRSGRHVQTFPPWVFLLLDAWEQYPELLALAA